MKSSEELIDAMADFDIYEDTIKFLEEAKEINEYNLLIEKWKVLFFNICKYLGFDSDKSCEILWKDLCCGNFHKLHLTKKEKELTSIEWLDAFYEDALYCSDRWSLDRLMRCHWRMRKYIDTLSSEQEDYKIALAI